MLISRFCHKIWVKSNVMNKYKILLAYFDKQLKPITKLYNEMINTDFHILYAPSHFAGKAQQFYTAFEDLLKQIAKAFENHIEKLNNFHIELLNRMTLDIKNIRPKLLSSESFALLDQLRKF